MKPVAKQLAALHHWFTQAALEITIRLIAPALRARVYGRAGGCVFYGCGWVVGRNKRGQCYLLEGQCQPASNVGREARVGIIPPAGKSGQITNGLPGEAWPSF
jgi:hypothetical protein